MGFIPFDDDCEITGNCDDVHTAVLMGGCRMSNVGTCMLLYY